MLFHVQPFCPFCPFCFSRNKRIIFLIEIDKSNSEQMSDQIIPTKVKRPKCFVDGFNVTAGSVRFAYLINDFGQIAFLKLLPKMLFSKSRVLGSKIGVWL
jgi:hypothetical protein